MRAWRLAPIFRVRDLWSSRGEVGLSATTAPGVAAASASAVVISGPLAESSVVNTALEVSVTAPGEVLVAVTIVAAATAGASMVQPNENPNASVTSEADQSWVFVPQVTVVAGAFAVSASYTTAADRWVKSGLVAFVVATGAGQATVVSAGFGGGGLSGERSSGSGCRGAWPLLVNTMEDKRCRRAQKERLADLEEWMRELEGDLESTPEALEDSYSPIGGLRLQIDEEVSEPDGEHRADRSAGHAERYMTVPAVAHDGPDISKQI